ncbi:MAG TPA: hypothetical protein VI488_13965 [Candidatus Angelobacter sp.]
MSALDIRGLILIDTAQAGLPFALAPLALLDVAGMSPLERVAERLQRQGVSALTVVSEESSASRRYRPLPQGIVCRSAARGRFWRVAESAFNDLAHNGADLVLVIRLGAYAEVHFDELVQFHLEGQRRVSQVVWCAEPLEIFCLTASRRNDAASLFRSRLAHCRCECELFAHSGYFNPLAGPRDLRQFAIDVLTLQAETGPAGTEIRPGVWVASGASIEKGSRILAPAFIGASSQVRCGAVITRCTSIEHHAHVDCGTVVENSTVLPYSYVGAGLDVAHSVLGMGHIANLRRGISVEVPDKKLLGQVSPAWRRELLRVAGRLPGRIWQSIFGDVPAPQPPLQEVARQPSPEEDAMGRPAPALGVSPRDAKVAGELASDLAVARRYGNQ